MKLLRWAFKIYCQPFIDAIQGGLLEVEDEKGKRSYWYDNKKEREQILEKLRRHEEISVNKGRDDFWPFFIICISTVALAGIILLFVEVLK